MDKQLLLSLVDDQDFLSCRTWYLVNGQNGFLQLMLEDETDQTFAKRLFDSMYDEVSNYESETTELEAELTHIRITSDATSTASDKVSDIISTLKVQAGQWFKKMKEERLKTFSADPSIRKAAALQTLSYQQKNKECWQDIQFVQQNGYLPGDAAEREFKDHSVEELMTETKKLENYIRKFTKKEREGTISDHVQEELKKRKEQLLRINKEIAKR